MGENAFGAADDSGARPETVAWLVDQIRSYGLTPAEAVHGGAFVSDLALDSIYAMMLSADIEDVYGFEIEIRAFRGHERLSDLARDLDERIAAA